MKVYITVQEEAGSACYRLSCFVTENNSSLLFYFVLIHCRLYILEYWYSSYTLSGVTLTSYS